MKTRASIDDAQDRPLGAALKILGLLSYRLGRYDEARSLLRQSLDCFNTLGLREWREIDVLLDLGCNERDCGELAEARRLLTERLVTAEKVGG